MGPFDLFSEKQLSDRMNDASSREFLKDSNSGNSPSKAQIAHAEISRDKVSMATASLVLGSPFMMFGLGVAFMEELGLIKSSKQFQALQSERRRLFTPRQSFEIAEQKITSKNFIRRGAEMSLGVMFTLDEIEQRAARGRRARTGDRTQAVFSDMSRNRTVFLSPERGWLKASKLVKEKESLKNQLEKLNNGQNFNLITRLAAKIELLDKALKKLGC